MMSSRVSPLKWFYKPACHVVNSHANLRSRCKTVRVMKQHRSWSQAYSYSGVGSPKPGHFGGTIPEKAMQSYERRLSHFVTKSLILQYWLILLRGAKPFVKLLFLSGVG
jgi:hypothetical protein